MRFSLRTLLVLVTLAGGPLACVAHRLSVNRHQAQVVESLRRFPGGARFYEIDDSAILPYRRVQRVCLSSKEFNDDDLRLVCSLGHVADLRIGQAQVSDEALAMLQTLPRLKLLSLSCASVSDAGMSHIGELLWLEKLFINGTRVSDASIPRLARLSNLKVLAVKGTSLSDEGIARLRRALPACEIAE